MKQLPITNLKHQLRDLFKSLDFVSKNFLTGKEPETRKANSRIYYNIYQQLGLAWEYLGLQCQHWDGYKRTKDDQSVCKICGKVKGIKERYYFLPQSGLKTIGKRLDPNSTEIFRNKKEAMLFEDSINFQGVHLKVDVHNAYQSRLLTRNINMAAERIVSFSERGIKCSIDQHLIHIHLPEAGKKVVGKSYGGFVWELRKKTLRHFPVLFDFDQKGRLLEVTILR